MYLKINNLAFEEPPPVNELYFFNARFSAPPTQSSPIKHILRDTSGAGH